jgi:thiol-disulfide isomerase/thioredoxin
MRYSAQRLHGCAKKLVEANHFRLSMTTTDPLQPFHASRRLALQAAVCAVWPASAGAQPKSGRGAQETPDLPGAQRKPWPRGTATPALQLLQLDGAVWRLAAHRGKPLLLNFWASWCEPCRSEMPALAQLAARYQADGLQLLAVNFQEADAAVRRFVQATNLTLPVLRDADGAAARALGVHIFPTTVAINAQGRALFSIVGACDWGSPAVDRWVAELL